jgi:hypothetical protein
MTLRLAAQLKGRWKLWPKAANVIQRLANQHDHINNTLTSASKFPQKDLSQLDETDIQRILDSHTAELMMAFKQLAALTKPEDDKHSQTTADWHQLTGSTLKMDDLD